MFTSKLHWKCGNEHHSSNWEGKNIGKKLALLMRIMLFITDPPLPCVTFVGLMHRTHGTLFLWHSVHALTFGFWYHLPYDMKYLSDITMKDIFSGVAWLRLNQIKLEKIVTLMKPIKLVNIVNQWTYDSQITKNVSQYIHILVYYERLPRKLFKEMALKIFQLLSVILCDQSKIHTV